MVGEIISEANGTGKKLKTSIYAAGATLARQIVGYDATSGNPTLQEVEFDQWDASGMSYRRTFSNIADASNGVRETGETDPLGGGVGLDGLAYFEANLPPERDYLLRQPSGFEDVAVHQNGAEIACYEDGVLTSCGRAYRNLENGSAIPKVHLRQERDPRRKTKPLPAVVFETLGGGRISGGYYDNAGDGTRIDPLTGEEILVVNTGFVELSFIVPGSWNTRQQTQSRQTNTAYPLKDLIDAARKVIENAKEKCAKLLGKDALSEFDRISKNIVYNPRLFSNSGLGHSARTIDEDINLNPNSFAFNPTARASDLTPPGKKLNQALDKTFKDSKASSRFDYAVAGIIHEFLHVTGEFAPDTIVTAFGSDSRKSIENQNRVIKDCFTEQNKNKK